MAFGQQSGPPASAKQMKELLALLGDVGHTDFRDARGPMGLTQRQAAGKFTRDEAEAFIARLQGDELDGKTLATAPTGRLLAQEQLMRHLPAEQLAVEVPELVLRNEPAHREAFIHLGPGGQIEPAQWQLISQSMQRWVEEHSAQPSQLGARITYLADPTTPENQGPDCDFAIPIT